MDQGRPGDDNDGAGDGGDHVADRGPSALPADISNALSELGGDALITFHSLSALSHIDSRS